MIPAALTISLFIILVLGLAAIFLLCSKDKYVFLKKIHREQKFGAIISTTALVWAGIQGYELLGQDFPSIASVIPILVPALVLGVFFLMDYIFTRAVGGLMIMLVCELFYIGQESEMPVRFIFSLCGYALTVAGMYMIGQPWRFRNLLFKAINDGQFGKKMAIGIVSTLVVMFIPFICTYV
jgi:hypothetical protein